MRPGIRSWLFTDDNRIDVKQGPIRVTLQETCNSQGDGVRARRPSRKHAEIDFLICSRHFSIAKEYHEVGDTEPRQYHTALEYYGCLQKPLENVQELAHAEYADLQPNLLENLV